MAVALAPNATSVGTIDFFKGNFTKALYLRGQSSSELERRLGYGPGRLAQGWWLIFALDKPASTDFEFGGYTHFSGSRIGDPKLGASRDHVETDLAKHLGGSAGVAHAKIGHVAGLELSGPNRLAKVIPVAPGNDYPVGAGIYQCNVTSPVKCKVAAFVPPGGTYLGNYN